MGARGVLPKKRSHLELVGKEGTHRPPKKTSRPRPRPVAPIKPRWLDRYAASVWDRLVRELEPLGMLNPTARELMISFCTTASVNFNAYKALTPNRRRGPDVLDRGRREGELVRAKAWGILRESSKLLDQLGRSLVIPNPAALLRAELPEEHDPDDESDLD